MIRYYGGKHYQISQLHAIRPASISIAVDGFGGSGKTFWRVPRFSPREVYIDIDPELVNLYHVVQTNPSELKAILTRWGHSESKYNSLLYGHRQPTDPINRAARFAYLTQNARNGVFGNTISRSQSIRRGMAEESSAYLGMIERIYKYHTRIRGTEIRCAKFIDVCEDYDSETTWFYLDPPYVPSTRAAPDKGYRFEMTLADHVRLLDRAKQLRGRVMISGYDHPLYNAMLRGWNKHKIQAVMRSAPKIRYETAETAWTNY